MSSYTPWLCLALCVTAWWRKARGRHRIHTYDIAIIRKIKISLTLTIKCGGDGGGKERKRAANWEHKEKKIVLILFW